MKINSVEDMFDINKILQHLESIEARKHKKESERAEGASKQFAEVSRIFKDEMLKNGFSKEFTETLLLEIIKNTILKGEF